MPYSWVYFNLVKNVSKQKTFHSCQIPEQLSELLIKASTEENDVVFIPFGGSGAEIAVCLRTNRRFVSAEIDETYYKMILNRIENEGAVDWTDRLLYQIRQKQHASGQLHLIRESATQSLVEVTQ
ncbi:MAG: methylase domain protein [Dehalococcoidia bacterium]|nr:methylase domain protein [Dehalococcoidia bacterium]